MLHDNIIILSLFLIYFEELLTSLSFRNTLFSRNGTFARDDIPSSLS